MRKRVAGIGNRGHVSAVIGPFVVAVGIAAALFTSAVARPHASRSAGTPASAEATELAAAGVGMEESREAGAEVRSPQPAADSPVSRPAGDMVCFVSCASGGGTLRGFNPHYTTPAQMIPAYEQWWGGRVGTIALHMPFGCERQAGKGDYFAFDAWLNLQREAKSQPKLAGMAEPAMWRAFIAHTDRIAVRRVWYLGKVDHLESAYGEADLGTLSAFVARCIEIIPRGDAVVIDDSTDYRPGSLGWRIALCVRAYGREVGVEPTASKGSAWDIDTTPRVMWITASLYHHKNAVWPVVGREHVQCFPFTDTAGREVDPQRPANLRKYLEAGDVPMLNPAWFKANPGVTFETLRKAA